MKSSMDYDTDELRVKLEEKRARAKERLEKMAFAQGKFNDFVGSQNPTASASQTTDNHADRPATAGAEPKKASFWGKIWMRSADAKVKLHDSEEQIEKQQTTSGEGQRRESDSSFTKIQLESMDRARKQQAELYRKEAELKRLERKLQDYDTEVNGVSKILSHFCGTHFVPVADLDIS
jgi:hypothetical protein